MNFHQLIDDIGKWTPRTKLFVAGGAILALSVIAIVYSVLVYNLGVNSGSTAATVQYNEREQERMKTVDALQVQATEADKNAAAHWLRAEQFSAENQLLKQQNELQARVLSENDDTRRAQAQENLSKIYEEQRKKYEDIKSNVDFSGNICALCADYDRAGFKLSDEFCGKCKAAQPGK